MQEYFTTWKMFCFCNMKRKLNFSLTKCCSTLKLNCSVDQIIKSLTVRVVVLHMFQNKEVVNNLLTCKRIVNIFALHLLREMITLDCETMAHINQLLFTYWTSYSVALLCINIISRARKSSVICRRVRAGTVSELRTTPTT